jgi:hypothetical protein
MSNDNFGGFFKRQGLLAYTKIINSITSLGTPLIEIKADDADTNIDISIVPKGLGCFTLSTPDGAIKGGDKRGAKSIDLQMIRTNSNQVASGLYAICMGQNNQSQGTGSIAAGTNNVATNNASIAIGATNSVTGIGSVALGSSNTAIANGSVAIGSNNTSNAVNATTLGGSNASSAIGASCLGSSNTASAIGATALGSTNTASGINSIASGKNASTFGIQGRVSHCSQNINSIGDSQYSTFNLKVETTDNIPNELSADPLSPSSATTLVLSNNSSYAFTGMIVARQASSTNTAAWKIEGFITRGVNAAATILVVSTVTAISNVPAWTAPSLVANVSAGGLSVVINGVVATTIRWNSRIDTTEVF